ncbi:PhzF family phenazine biosynthesis protein [Streptosporangiaceae bacterium NEAU-GS5]|nr:PhzF family phenazine biosynthesis protein [Streptosporangiaceae bacterium NEAU-GS5]
MRIFTVDAFTDQPFKGNPAAVCLLEGPADDTWMRSVAAEMRHAETAFLLGDSLRWFTPEVEVDLCGHATLATAHILYTTGIASGSLHFHTRSGILTTDQTAGGFITMDFPAIPTQDLDPADEFATPAGLAALTKALGAEPVKVSRSKFDLLIEVEAEAVVRSLTPDIAALATIDARGIIVTASATSAASDAASSPAAPGGIASGHTEPTSAAPDFVSRFFGPRVGIPEDPVTGSAHCVLAPYWSARLGRDTLLGAQVSARGGLVRTTLAGDRVILAGQAVTIWSGDLHA